MSTSNRKGIGRRGLLGGLVAAAAGLTLGGARRPARALPAPAGKPAEPPGPKKPIWIGHF
jgi:hypothetical protein